MTLRVLCFLLAVAVVGAGEALAWDPLQKAERLAGQGSDLLAAGRTDEALEALLQAQALAPDDADIRMAVAEALFQAGELSSAGRQYVTAAAQGEEGHERQGFYNAGNAAFAEGKLEQAVELYRRAVLSGAPDADLLYNLELAQRLLEEGEQEPQEGEDGEPQDQEQQDQQEEQEQQDQQQQDQQQDEEGQQQEQQEQEGEGEEQEQEGEQEQQEQEEAPADSTQTPPAPQDSTAQAPPDSLMPAPPQGMTPEQAQRLLEALDADEEELRRSIQRRLRGTARESTKDW